MALLGQLKAPRALDAPTSLSAPNNLSEVHSGIQQQELWRVTKRLNVPRGCEQSLSKLKQSVTLKAVGGHRAPSPPSRPPRQEGSAEVRSCEGHGAGRQQPSEKHKKQHLEIRDSHLRLLKAAAAFATGTCCSQSRARRWGALRCQKPGHTQVKFNRVV